MSGKLVIAVILALQVTVSLCDEVKGPSPELEAKYIDYRDAFIKRMKWFLMKGKEVMTPLAEKIPESDTTNYVKGLGDKPIVQSAIKVTSGLAGETTPLLDKVRTTLLKLYEEHAREYVGTYLDKGISGIKEFLDTAMPMEETDQHH